MNIGERTPGYLVRGEMQREMMRIFGKEMGGRTDGKGLRDSNWGMKHGKEDIGKRRRINCVGCVGMS